MSYTVILFDRAGNASPQLPCDIHCGGTELEIDAELSYEYISNSCSAHILDDREVVSEHAVLGYNFIGDTIINGVNASRSGQYILFISPATSLSVIIVYNKSLDNDWLISSTVHDTIKTKRLDI